LTYWNARWCRFGILCGKTAETLRLPQVSFPIMELPEIMPMGKHFGVRFLPSHLRDRRCLTRGLHQRAVMQHQVTLRLTEFRSSYLKKYKERDSYCTHTERLLMNLTYKVFASFRRCDRLSWHTFSRHTIQHHFFTATTLSLFAETKYASHTISWADRELYHCNASRGT